MTRSYQIDGLDFSLTKIFWRYENELHTTSGLLLHDNIPPCVKIVLPTAFSLPETAEEALQLIQCERGETALGQDETMVYVVPHFHDQPQEVK